MNIRAPMTAACFSILLAGRAYAHCDSVTGPLIPEAMAALEKGEDAPVLKWVKKSDEAEVRKAFAKTVAVRSKGPEAKELADRYFLETLVRLHRAGEGAPFTGIKNEPADPVAVMSDKALAEGKPDDMIAKLSARFAEAVRRKFHRALETKKRKDASVEAGREFVEAYVIYTHYLEALHKAIAAEAGQVHGH